MTAHRTTRQSAETCKRPNAGTTKPELPAPRVEVRACSPTSLPALLQELRFWSPSASTHKYNPPTWRSVGCCGVLLLAGSGQPRRKNPRGVVLDGSELPWLLSDPLCAAHGLSPLRQEERRREGRKEGKACRGRAALCDLPPVLKAG